MGTQLSSFSKRSRFEDLVDAVQQCTLCPRLCGRTKVLSEANGDIESTVLFVAEAPGRLGAEVTGVPLSGDRTGENFEALLAVTGWPRRDVFITNAVLCNPQDERGKNDTPTTAEMANCASYLNMTIELVDPELVAPLGAIALRALALVHPHPYELRRDVAQIIPWAGRQVFPLYHPGPRAAVHRSVDKQQEDFRLLSEHVHAQRSALRGSATPQAPQAPSVFQQLVLTVVEALGEVTYFKLTKLLYLIDLSALRKFGSTLTGEVYLRQKDGPWPPRLWDAIGALDGWEIVRPPRRRLPMVGLGPSPRFDVELDDAALDIVAAVLERYGDMDNSGIKRAAYHTNPMRYILRQEKHGRNMRNAPVMYKDRLAEELDEEA